MHFESSNASMRALLAASGSDNKSSMLNDGKSFGSIIVFNGF